MREVYAPLRSARAMNTDEDDDEDDGRRTDRGSAAGPKRTIGRLQSPFLQDAATPETSAAAGAGISRKPFRPESAGDGDESGQRSFRGESRKPFGAQAGDGPPSARLAAPPSRNIAAFAASISRQQEEALSSRGPRPAERYIPAGAVQVMVDARVDPRASLSTTTSSEGELYSASRAGARSSEDAPDSLIAEGDTLVVTVCDARGLPARAGSTASVSLRYGRQEARTQEGAVGAIGATWSETHRFEVADPMEVLNLVVQQREYGRPDAYVGEVNTRASDLRSSERREEWFPLVSRRPGKMPQGEVRVRLSLEKRARQMPPPERAASPPLLSRRSGKAGLETVVEENSAAPSLQQSPEKGLRTPDRAARRPGRLHLSVVEARVPAPQALHGRELVCAVRYGAQEGRTGPAPPAAALWDKAFVFEEDEGADMVTATLLTREPRTGAEAYAAEARVPLLGMSAGDVLEDWFLLVSKRPGDKLGGEVRLRVEFKEEREREGAGLERLMAHVEARGLLSTSPAVLAARNSARGRYTDQAPAPAAGPASGPASGPALGPPRLAVTVKEARGLAARASGGGRPVPYVVVRLGPHELRTAPAPASFSPAWDHELLLELPPGPGAVLSVSIMDRDAMGPPSADACLGQALVPLDGVPPDGFTVDRWHPVTLAGGRRQAGEIRLAVRAERGPAGPAPAAPAPRESPSPAATTPSTAPASGGRGPPSARRYGPTDPEGGFPTAALARRFDAPAEPPQRSPVGGLRQPSPSGRRGPSPEPAARSPAGSAAAALAAAASGGAAPGSALASALLLSSSRQLAEPVPPPAAAAAAPQPAPASARDPSPAPERPPPTPAPPAPPAPSTSPSIAPPAPRERAATPAAGEAEQPLRCGAMVYLTVVEACDVAARDLNGKSDPYAVVYLGSSKVQSSHVVTASTEPVWGFACALDVRDVEDTVTVVVMNRNRLLRDDYLGEVSLPLSRLRASAPPLDGWFQLVSTKPGVKVSGQVHLKVYCINPGGGAAAAQPARAAAAPSVLGTARSAAPETAREGGMEGPAGGRLKVTIGEVRNLARRDAAGTSEPCCVIRYMGQEQKVPLGAGGERERVVEVRDVTAPVGFFVFESARLSGDDYIGEVLVQPSSVMQGPGPSEAWFRLLANGRPGAEGRLTGQLHLRFAYEPPGAGPDAPLKHLQPALGRREGESALHEIARELQGLFETLRDFPGGKTSAVVQERLKAVDEKIARLALFLDKERRQKPASAPGSGAALVGARLAPGGPPARAYVEVREGRGLAARDASGLADAYAVVRCGHAEQRTPVHWETSHPVWQWSGWFEAAADLRSAAGLLADLQLGRAGSLSLEGPPGDRVTVTLFDRDKIGSDDYLGEVTVPLREVLAAGGSLERWFPVTSSRPSAAARGELLCRLVYLPPAPPEPAAAASASAASPAEELLELRRCVGVLRERAEEAGDQLAAARSEQEARSSMADTSRIRTELEARGLREELAAAREELGRTREELAAAREREAATERHAQAREAAIERELREAAITRQSLPALTQDAELRLREASDRARRAEERCQRLQQLVSELQAERTELQRQCQRMKEDVEVGRNSATRAQLAEGELRRKLAQNENEIQIYRHYIERKLGGTISSRSAFAAGAGAGAAAGSPASAGNATPAAAAPSTARGRPASAGPGPTATGATLQPPDSFSRPLGSQRTLS